MPLQQLLPGFEPVQLAGDVTPEFLRVTLRLPVQLLVGAQRFNAGLFGEPLGGREGAMLVHHRRDRFLLAVVDRCAGVGIVLH